jgi:exopolysaccharide production protein ExoQ
LNAEISIPQTASLERGEARGLAFAVGFFFSFRLAIVLISSRLLGLEPSTGSALSIGIDLTLFSLIVFSSVGDRNYSFSSILRLPAIRWVLLFLFFACISLAWSETASLPSSIGYWIGLVIDVANVILLMRRESRQDDAVSILKGFIWSSCLLAIVAWLMPVQPDLRLGDEEFFNTNEIANLCGFGLFFAQYLTRRNGEQWRFVKFLLVITLVRSLSKSTLVAFLVSQGFLLIFDKSMSQKMKMVLMVSALVVILAFWGLFAAYYDVYTNAGNQAETLTGRTGIWLYVVNAVFEHPWNLWVGHGFDSWWKVVPPFGPEMFEARHAENELLQQFYVFGIAGIVLLAGVYGSLFRQLKKLPRCATRVIFLCMLVFIVVRGVAVADSFDLLLPLWSIALISVLAELERAGTQGFSVFPKVVISGSG